MSRYAIDVRTGTVVRWTVRDAGEVLVASGVEATARKARTAAESWVRTSALARRPAGYETPDGPGFVEVSR